MTYQQQGDPVPALELLQGLRRDFPDSVLMPETLYFLGI